MEGHATVPDAEEGEGVGPDPGDGSVEQHVADAAAKHHAHHAVEHEVAEAVGADRQAALAAAILAERPSAKEASEVHEPVPVDLKRSEGQRDGIDIDDERSCHGRPRKNAGAKCSAPSRPAGRLVGGPGMGYIPAGASSGEGGV